ncbi:MAG: hypothetical protein QXX08_10050 [Candidatus Bathyarchaeia archaeon]
MSRSKNGYSLQLDISPLYQGKTYDVNQEIQIFMPPDTEVVKASPSNITTWSGNAVTFTIHTGDIYPKSFSITSAVPSKSTTQIFLESAGQWIMLPSSWVAIGSLIVIFYTAFRGGRMWGRRRTYYRLYRSMVSIYDHYASNYSQFFVEMENLSVSILRYFIDDKITDDQFEKLLRARDNLMNKVKKP